MIPNSKENEKTWFFSRHISFKRTSALFAGLGSLLIDGDALICQAPKILKDSYLDLDQTARLTEPECVKLFLDKLNASGFDRIKIVFFHVHSKWTQRASNAFELTAEAARLFQDHYDVSVFDDWRENAEWENFVVNEHTSLILTTEEDIYTQEDSQFKFIYDVNQKFKVQVSLLEHSIVGLSSFQSFVINPLKSIIRSLSQSQCDEIRAEHQAPTENGRENTIPNHEIKNLKLRELLGIQGELKSNGEKVSNGTKKDKEEEVVDSWENLSDAAEDEEPEGEHETPTITPYSYSEFTWDLGLSDKLDEEKENWTAEDRLNNRQKYYRFMEVYATSLDTLKHLHHKIVVQEKSKLEPKQVKLSKKALEIIKNQELDKQKKEEKQDEEFFKTLEKSVKCFDDIDKGLKGIDMNRFKTRFFSELTKLRIKWLKNENASFPSRKANLFLYINELFDDYAAFLSQEEAVKYLELLQKFGFGCTADHLCATFNGSKAKAFKESVTIKSWDKDTKEQEIMFQLSNLGDKLKRTLNSESDSRVKFKPDQWQRQLLDLVDKRESAVVCCPTSSGKTFISYYAMEQSLRANDDDMVVFVSPFKALANQVAAEVYARFGSKAYPSFSKKSVYAMFMPDFQINDFQNCQILITMPNSLETLLSEKTEVAKKIKYIILDEIHMLSDRESGRSLEKIVHFAPCPIIALSATIGNLDPFYNWMKDVYESKGVRTHKIVHTERFCDLKKHIFVPKSLVVDINNNRDSEVFSNFDTINELFGYSEPYLRSYELSKDFHLLPGEIIDVLKTLERIAQSPVQKELVKSVQPGQFFSCVVINKKQVKNYESHLMNSLRDWYRQGHFSQDEIKKFFEILNRKCESIFQLVENRFGSSFSSPEWAVDNIVELVETLQEKKLLPAIMFFKSSDQCDAMAAKLLETLMAREAAENKEKQPDDREIRDLEKEKKRAIRAHEQAVKNTKLSKEDAWRELASHQEQLASFAVDPNIIDDKFTFLDPKFKMGYKEIDELAWRAQEKSYKDQMVKQWKRGIGVHHPNINKRYCQITEMLFRKKHLQIVFATDTLACGINLPCKTVILSHEVVNYDSVNYRHTIGRAGRRGYDTIGNVVYYGMPKQKIQNFISSKTSNIAGVSIFDPRFIMQMSAMQDYNSETFGYFASIMNNPIIKLNNSSYDKEFVKEAMRMQVNYLVDNGTIDSEFKPDASVDLVLPLRHEDFPVEVIAELVSDGFFEDLAEYRNKDLNGFCQKIILVLSHLVRVDLVLPSQSQLVKSPGYTRANFILPRVPELESYLEAKCHKIDSYLKQSSLAQSKVSYDDHYLVLARLFPVYLTQVKQPKNSSIYDFYMNGQLKEISQKNHQTITSFWYTVTAMKKVLKVLKTYPTAYSVAFKKCYNRFHGLHEEFD